MGEHETEIQALRATPFFAELRDEDLENVVAVGRRARFDAGTAIFEQGDAGDAMYVVISGRAQVDVGGRFHNLDPGSFFGEMALLRKAKRSATVRAVEPVEALVIRADDFRDFLLGHPSVSVTMLGALADRLSEVQERIEAWMA
jgi:CRP-like cAMP-binding protein